MVHPLPPMRPVLVAAQRRVASFHAIPPPIRDELAQEAALRTWQCAGVTDPAALASRIARNLAVDWLRRQRFVVPLEHDVAGRDPWARADARLDVARALEALDRAPPTYRHVVSALYVEDRDVGELVDEETSADTLTARHRARDRIYKRRRRGLAWLRERLQGAA